MVNVYVKVATTDRSARPQIVQISAVDTNGQSFNRFIYPSRQISPDASNAHGIIRTPDGLFRNQERLPATSVGKDLISISLSSFWNHTCYFVLKLLVQYIKNVVQAWLYSKVTIDFDRMILLNMQIDKGKIQKSRWESKTHTFTILNFLTHTFVSHKAQKVVLLFNSLLKNNYWL